MTHQKDWLAFYNSVAAVPGVDPYRKFTAYAYVITVSGIYGYPNTATIICIASVVIEDGIARLQIQKERQAAFDEKSK